MRCRNSGRDGLRAIARALALAALLASLPEGRAAAPSPVRSVSVSHDGLVYASDAVFFAPVRPAVAWEVLTDFDRMADWVPNVSESRMVRRDGDTVTVEQRGWARFGVLGFPFRSTRRLEMKRPVTLKSVQVEGSLRHFESLMTLEPEGEGTRLVYHVEVVPGFLAGAVLSKEFLAHEIAEQFAAIVAEMIRRGR